LPFCIVLLVYFGGCGPESGGLCTRALPLTPSTTTSTPTSSSSTCTKLGKNYAEDICTLYEACCKIIEMQSLKVSLEYLFDFRRGRREAGTGRSGRNLAPQCLTLRRRKRMTINIT